MEDVWHLGVGVLGALEDEEDEEAGFDKWEKQKSHGGLGRRHGLRALRDKLGESYNSKSRKFTKI